MFRRELILCRRPATAPERSPPAVFRLVKGISIDICSQDVLVVEDIVDTGLTIRWIIDYLKSFQPRSVGVCALSRQAGATTGRGAYPLCRT
ncbi:MAG: hypothetical protein MZV70_13150 [Desulfobacterales bacterium]|nr:hypothetical protein [Desulfobacterales bacterium]